MKKLILFVLAVVSLAACNNPKTYRINLKLSNADNKTVYLQKDGKTLDSLVMTTPDTVFNTPTCDDQEMYAIMIKGWRRPFYFFTDQKDLCVSGDAQKPNNLVVEGSETQARLDAFNQNYNKMEASLEDDITIEPKEAERQLKEYCLRFIQDNPTDPVAHYVLYRYKWSFSPSEMRSLIDNIHQANKTLTSSNIRMAEEYVVKLERVQAGQPIIDFTQNDPDGNPVTLSTLADDKLLLVDFWASWCPDCRKANPEVVAAYQKYHDQGFDVLGVSFDNDKEAWLKAVEKDGLTWTQVSDLQGWSNAAGVLYSIAFIPQNALIKDGKIVARNLEGEALMNEIENQLGK